MNNYKTRFKFKKNQNGVALAIGIILLLIISVIGVNSMKSALLQEKMAGGLTNRNYADAAAYSLMVTVENYLSTLYLTNNGVEGITCTPYCDDEPRSALFHDFITQKEMASGMTYPGSSNHLSSLLPYIGGEPRFVLSQTSETNSNSSNSGAGGSLVTVGESEDGSAGSSSGSDGNNPESKAETFRLATKASDRTGNYFVVYESMYLMRTN